MRIVHRLVPGLLAASLLLAGASGALAANGKATPRWAVAGGQISSLAGNALTLTLNPKAVAKGTAARTLQVTLAPAVKEQARKGTTGVPAAGDYAVVVGTRSQTSMTANRVVYSATAFPTGRLVRTIRARHTLAVLAHHTARGTVQSSTGMSLVTATRAGKTLTFQLTSSTRFRVNGQLAQAAPTFTNGEQVAVRYTRDKTTQQLVASAVIVRAS